MRGGMTRLSMWLNDPVLIRGAMGRMHTTPRGELYARSLCVLITMLIIALLVVHVTTIVELDAELELYHETLLSLTWDWPTPDRREVNDRPAIPPSPPSPRASNELPRGAPASDEAIRFDRTGSRGRVFEKREGPWLIHAKSGYTRRKSRLPPTNPYRGSNKSGAAHE